MINLLFDAQWTISQMSDISWAAKGLYAYLCQNQAHPVTQPTLFDNRHEAAIELIKKGLIDVDGKVLVKRSSIPGKQKANT